MVRGARDTRVVRYWWTTRGLTTSDPDRFRQALAWRSLFDNRSWGAFVRIEAIVPGDDLAGTQRRVADFSGRVAHDLPAVFAAAESRRGARR